ncbi:hypothetical protein LTR36_005119 [Oleoguttula mirabilis]|uniref:Glutaminase n=1 Tax=Oleoguttula mirabilis TaxID=1507867 RepID=A0AAV9JVU3_9PEZI|nr:hypothetical protein LTR36_005119 [Oleoguttula mirabilis]
MPSLSSAPFSLLSIFLFLLFVACSPTFTPVLPPSYPLAVRNPYLSAWLPGNQAQDLPFAVPQFWNGQNLTWSVIARINGQAYSLFGVPIPGSGVKAASVQSAEYTSTHTTFTLTAGPASFVLDFLSPISPLDYVRQSLPFSYLTVSTSGTNGATPDVQIYSDIDNSWIGQFGFDMQTSWSYATTEASTSVLTLTPGGTATYSEVNDMAQWGTAVYCARGSNVSAGVGMLDAVRGDFAANGSLSGSWQWQPGSVMGYSQDLGTVSGATNVTFAVGYWRQAAVNYMGNARTAYFTSSCQDINCACVHALTDFEAADTEARTLDATIASKAAGVGGANYSDIVALSARQAFGAIDITIPLDTLDTSDVMAFIKEISSDGNVNTIDVIFPTSPIFYVMAPEYIRLLLEPVMQYLATGDWPQDYTVHDIGSNYPNSTGHNDGNAEQMPVEESGNLLTLAALYYKASGDDAWCNKYQSLFQGYADYLIVNGLYPATQLSTDDGAGEATNQTGLSIKAAVALNAFGVMTHQSNYSEYGEQFATVLYNHSVGVDSGKTHFTLVENADDTWALEFNLYMDVLLGLNTFPTAALAMQTSYYPSVRKPAGVALDSSLDWGKTDWMIFAAATAMAQGVGNEGVRDMFVEDVHSFVSNGLNPIPFSDKYFVENSAGDVQGEWNGYRNRPVVGGHFALMALDGPAQIQIGAGESHRRKERRGG